ncbi:hypothetical protein VTH06DRAFT_8265 [Thermothelomyces fergusii]
MSSPAGILEYWDKEDSPLQQSLSRLQELLPEHTVAIEPEWTLLANELAPHYYPDGAGLVATVAGCVRAWAAAVADLLADPARGEWADTVRIRAPVRMRVFVDVSEAAEASVSVSWSERRRGFVLRLPKGQVSRPEELPPLFREQLLGCFDVVGEKVPHDRVAVGGAADDWEGVEVDPETGRPEMLESPPGRKAPPPPPPSRAKPRFMPDVASLPRPDRLFLHPPYHLTLVAGQQTIELQGSHSPTLEFIAAYLNRWCRANHADTRTPPAVQVTLHQSAFGLGEMFDRLTLSTAQTRYTDQFTVTAPMIVSLIEGTLGYDLISTHGRWVFRRDANFETL